MTRRVSLEPLSWGLLALAVGSVAWAHFDARSVEGPTATLVSSRSAAWRILPELANTDAAGATIELVPGQGAAVRLVPEGLGHQLWVGDEVLGPADPEAVAGLWDSLRMATTLRAVDEEVAAGLGEGGRIVVELPQGGVRTIVLGRPTPDEVGRYGALEADGDQAEGTEGLWVLEQELHTLIEQASLTWLARRVAVAEPADVAMATVGDAQLRRGLDGLWRARIGDGPIALVDRAAVETRLDRIVSARLDPLVEPNRSPASAWVQLQGIDGRDWAIATHGPCPGRPDRIVVDRGVGRWGCIDAQLVTPWPLPLAELDGGAATDASAMLEPRLLPHGYGRVLRVEQRRPQRRVLGRNGGGWRLEEEVDGRTTIFDIDEPEVYRWYRALHEAEVVLDPGALDGTNPWPETVVADLSVATDSTASLRLRCTDEMPMRCRRDDGPVLQVRSDSAKPPAVAFDVDTFAERRLLSIAADDVRAIEIVGPGDDSPTVRQSAHFDLGVWRLDGPTHPQGDAALDEVRLQSLLATLGSLRADAWVLPPQGIAPLRTVRVERIVARDQTPQLRIDLYEDCVVQVQGHRAARLGEGACEGLLSDLLVDMPLERALLDARRIELRRGDTTVALTRGGEAWLGTDGAPQPDANAWLAEHIERSYPRLSDAEPPTAATWSLRILPVDGAAYTFEGGSGWIRVQGEPWHYRVAVDETTP